MPPIEGRWHGVSRDGEVDASLFPTVNTSQAVSLASPLEGSIFQSESTNKAKR